MTSTMLFMNNPTMEKDGVYNGDAIACVRIWKFNVL